MTDPKLNVLITGAGSGLGQGLSLCLAKQGHALLATDVDLKSARETVVQIGNAGGRAEAHALDVTSEEDIQRLLKDTEQQQIDVLINNAGLQHVSKLEQFAAAKWDKLIDVMLKGAFL